MNQTQLRRAAFASFVLTLLSLGAWVERSRGTGLGLRVFDEKGTLLLARTRAALGTVRIDALSAREKSPHRAEWVGYWVAPKSGLSELVLKTDGEAGVELDGEAILASGGQSSLGPRMLKPVAPGAHRLEISYRPSADPARRREIFLKGVTPDGASVPIDRRSTAPRMPSTTEGVMRVVEPSISLAAALAWVFTLGASIRADRARFARRAPALALGLLVLVAGALRFEALSIRYWGVEGPDWAEALAADIRSVRGGAFEHVPYAEAYSGDPFSYLGIARTMGGFYEPSAREPLFPALTRLALAFAGGRDIGINFLSALASTLTCLSIFALGARLLSPWSALLAAFLWAIEWQAISFSAEGWRDDLFTLQVAACAAGLVSLHLRPTSSGAILLGLVGGLTLLTRLSALTFLVPGIFAAALLPSGASRAERFRASGIALAGMTLLIGPFMISCAVAYGDPFHAVNVHAAFYRGRAGLEGDGGVTAIQFLAQSRRPWEFMETGFVGLTTVPFLNKWSGFGAWLPGLGEALRFMALAGLPILILRPAGLVVLVVLFSSMAPYAFTWDIAGGSEWRFTLPAYPFFLVSAALATETGLRALKRLATLAERRELARPVMTYGAVALGLATVIPWAHRQLQWLRVSEATSHGQPALIQAGAAARPFFTSGFRLVESGGGSRAFEMIEPEGTVRIPLPEGTAARVAIRRGGAAPLAPFEVWQGAARLLPLPHPLGRGEETETFAIAPSHLNVGGVVELRLVRLPAAATGPVHLLWIRVEP